MVYSFSPVRLLESWTLILVVLFVYRDISTMLHVFVFLFPCGEIRCHVSSFPKASLWKTHHFTLSSGRAHCLISYSFFKVVSAYMHIIHMILLLKDCLWKWVLSFHTKRSLLNRHKYLSQFLSLQAVHFKPVPPFILFFGFLAQDFTLHFFDKDFCTHLMEIDGEHLFHGDKF